MPDYFAVLISLALFQAPSQETEPARISKLVDQLSDGDIEARHQAALELRTLGDAAIPALEAAARTTDAGLRIMARKLLHDLAATSALIEDLRSDDVAENARAARAKLHKRYDPNVRASLLDALKSDDDQQAIQAAFLLTVHQDTAAALEGTPEILERTARVIAQGRDERFRWVAVEAVVRLGAASTDAARDAAWKRALVDVDPNDSHWGVLAVHQVSTRSKAPFPEALVRHYLKNLMNDTVQQNAQQCRYILRLIGPSLAPALRSALSGYDAQARAMAVDLLLEWKQADVPAPALVEAMSWSSRAREEVKSLGTSAVPFLLRALRLDDGDVVIEAAKAIIEIDPGNHHGALATSLSRLMARSGHYWGNHERAGELLSHLGRSAETALQAGLKESDPLVALSAARGLLAMNRERHLQAIAARAERELADDARRENARRASQLLFELGRDTLARLRTLLASERGQSLVCVAAVLARLGRLDELPPQSLEAVLAYADKFEEADEPGALVELLTWSEPIRAQVMQRLEHKGASKAAALRILLSDYEEEPWLTGRR
jgi:hypothetical protein